MTKECYYKLLNYFGVPIAHRQTKRVSRKLVGTGLQVSMISTVCPELSLHIPSKKWHYFEKEKTWTKISDFRASL